MELKNKKHEAFCQAYVKTCRFNAKLAYEQVFGSDVHNNQDRLMKREDIQQRIAEISAEEAKRFDENSILNNLTEIAFATDEKGNYIYSTKDRLKSMDLMTKVLGLQKQHIEMEANLKGTVDIVVDIVEDEDDVDGTD